MAILGQMSLVPPYAAPMQPVECILTLVNNGGGTLSINGIRGVVSDGSQKESVSGYAPQFALGPGMTTAILSGATQVYRATFIPYAPQGWMFLNPNLPKPPADPPQAFQPAMQSIEPGLPQNFVYNVGAVLTISDGSEVRLATTPLTVLPAPLALNGMLDFHIAAQSAFLSALGNP